ncbi:MAG: glutathione peroxidase [Gammaproteobacteria bacterium]|nr:MAG: glutathione peroxidase [Gammaproteobacteria bacterium]
MSDIYSYNWNSPDGTEHSMADYKDQVLLIVNTASKCGLTPQYKELQQLHDQFADKGLTILGFPCNQFLSQESGTDEQISAFCELNYGVTFPLSTKIEVNGKNTHPLFGFLKEQAPGLLGTKKIKWNFNKFLISRDGTNITRFSPKTTPASMTDEITALLD